jgi:hypothetical protein
MASMFKTIEKQGGSTGPQWLNSLPNPGDRYAYITREATLLEVQHPVGDTRAFTRAQARLHQLTPAPTTEEATRKPAGVGLNTWTPSWGARRRPKRKEKKPMRQSLCRSVILTVLSVTALVSAACAARTVNQVIADPSRYRNREVNLSGTVVDSYSLVNRGAYRIDDGTGQLWIVSDNGIPRKSARVDVKGTIREGFNLGSLGDRINLPSPVGSGLVLIESSHKAKN